MPQTFIDVACTVCGCVCDDLQVTVGDGRITQVRGACRLAEPWFAAISNPATRPAAAIDGNTASLAQAIERAAEILRDSRAPLVWGLTRSSTAGQRAAIALAEQLGGTVDTTASCHPAATLAFQNVGQSTCSLGEVRNRCEHLEVPIAATNLAGVTIANRVDAGDCSYLSSRRYRHGAAHLSRSRPAC